MKLILVGKAAAGKDFLKTRLSNKGFVSGVSHTTRPPRENEVNHQDYHFVDKQEFEDMISCGEFRRVYVSLMVGIMVRLKKISILLM